MKYLRMSCLALACFIGSASASFDDHFVPERIQTVEQDLAKKNVSKESVDAILEKSHYDQSVIDKINKPFEEICLGGVIRKDSSIKNASSKALSIGTAGEKRTRPKFLILHGQIL